VGISQIEKGGSVGICEISAIAADLQKAALIDIEIAGIWVALDGSCHMMQPAVPDVRGAGGHGPQAGVGRREPNLPSAPPVPERWTGYRFATRSGEGCGDIDILKGVPIGYRACEYDFDSLPLLDPVIRGKSGRGTEVHKA
jgi:hypothetical protein